MLGMFRKTQENSRFRLWIDDNLKRLERGSQSGLDVLSFGILFGLSKFNQYDQQTIDKETLEIIKHYQGDAVIFEYGCYFINWLDLWLYCNMKRLRENIMHHLLGKFVEGFSYALQVENLGNIVNNRLELYAKLVSEADLNGKDFYVIELIKRSRDMKMPTVHDFNNFLSLNTYGLIEEIWLKTKIKTYKKSFYPTFIEMLNNYSKSLS